MEYIKSFWKINETKNEQHMAMGSSNMKSIDNKHQQQIIGNSNIPQTTIISPSSFVSIIHENQQNRSNKCDFISSPSVESYHHHSTKAISKDLEGGHSNMGYSTSTQDISSKSIKSTPVFNQNQPNQ
jgi:hypothetical protein